MDTTYSGYSIQPRAAGPSSVVAFIVSVSTGRLVGSMSGANETAAVDAAERWVDALSSLSLPPALSSLPVEIGEGGTGSITAPAALTALGGAPISDPVFSGSGITVPFAGGVTIDGSVADFQVRCQDGTGRVQMYWNSTAGTSPTVANGGEDSSKVLITTDGVYKLYWSDGTGTSTGDPVTWQELLSVSKDRVDFPAGGTSEGSADNYLSASGADSGSPPSVASSGADADIDILLAPKGSGKVRFGDFTTEPKQTTTGHVRIKATDGSDIWLSATDVDPATT